MNDHDETPRPSSIIRRLGSTDAAIGVSCSALLLGLLLLHSLLAPPFRGPDEPQHLDLVREWSHDADYDVLTRQIATSVQQSLPLVFFYERHSRNLQQGEALPRSERPRFDELGPETPGPSYNQISQHGPLYPVLAGSAVAAIDVIEPGPRWAFDRELGLVRLLTILLVVSVPYLIVRAATAMGLSQAAAWLAGIVPSSIPQFTHINALVNNDALIALLGALGLHLVARLLRHGRSDKTMALLGVVAGLGLLTKGFIIGPLAAVAIAVVITWRRSRATLPQIARDTGVLAVTTTVAGGWWIVRNIWVYGTPQPTDNSFLPTAPDSFEPDAWTWFAAFRDTIPQTMFGRFGWLELSLGWRWVQVGLTFLGIGLGLAVVRAVLAKRRVTTSPLGLPELGVLLAPFVILLAFMALNTYQLHADTGVFPAMQGRYLFAALPFVAVLIAAGYGLLKPRHLRLLAAAAFVWVLVVQWASAMTMFGFYWAPGSLRDGVVSMLAWSPWPTAVSALFAAVAAVGVVACAVTGVMASSTRPVPDSPPQR